MVIGNRCLGRKMGFFGMRIVIGVGTFGCRGSDLIKMYTVGI